jgi:exodeoxyribonuclease VII small subunit
MSQPMTASAAPESQPSAEALSFESIVVRLETIAGRLEAGDVKLEDALALFEEGVQLSKQGSRRLDAAERRLEVLLASGDTQALSEADVMAPPRDT